MFIFVGATSLAYAQSFKEELNKYCIQKCTETELLQLEPPVGCECNVKPPRTDLPTVMFIVSLSSSFETDYVLRKEKATDQFMLFANLGVCN